MTKNCLKPLMIGIICCLGIIVYSNTLNVPFCLDDVPSIGGNPGIKHIGDLYHIWNCLPRRFVLYLSIAFNYHVNGLNVVGYHLFNIGVHLAAAILVWWLVLLTFETPVMKEEKIHRHAHAISLWAALIFVAHPIQTQAVTYIVQRDASMATMFYLASVCLYIKSRLSQNNGMYYIAALIAAILAMFTKETAITLPLMILLYEFTFLKSKQGLNWKYIVPFLLTILIIPFTILMTETSAARLQYLRSEPGLSSMQYLCTQLRVIVTYIRLVFVPLNQNLDYDYPVFKSILETPVLLSFLFLSTIFIAAIRSFPRYRLIFFSIFWFFLTLLPESSIFPIRDVIFEHRLYLPMVGGALFLVSFIYYALMERNMWLLKVALVLIVGWYACLTYQRNAVWQNEVALWSDTIRHSPHKARPYFDRANAYLDQGDLNDALADYHQAIAITPDYASAYHFRASYYKDKGDFDQAIVEYTKWIALDPRNASSYFERANAYLTMRQFDRALADFSKAAALNPNLIEIHDRLAVLYYLKGDYARAWICVHKSIYCGIKIDPKFLEDLTKASGHAR